MYCRRCGNIISGRKVNRSNERSKNKTGENYYFCVQSGYRWKGTGRESGNGKCTMKKSVNIEKTDYLVWETICNVFENSSYLKEQFKSRTLSKTQLERDDLQKERVKLQKKIIQLDRNITKMKKNIVEIQIKYFSMGMKKSERDTILEGVNKEIDKLETEKRETESVEQDVLSQKSWVNWIMKNKKMVSTMRSNKDVKYRRKMIESVIHKILVDFDHSTKEHILEVYLRLSLFNDKIKYHNVDKKSLGYDYVEGDKNTEIRFKRSKFTREYVKKKDKKLSI